MKTFTKSLAMSAEALNYTENANEGIGYVVKELATMLSNEVKNAVSVAYEHSMVNWGTLHIDCSFDPVAWAYIFDGEVSTEAVTEKPDIEYKSANGYKGILYDSNRGIYSLKIYDKRGRIILRGIDIRVQKYEQLKTVVDNMPKLFDMLVEKPRKGKWIDNENETISCSECGTWFPKERKPFLCFCGYCKADMRG